MSLLHKLERLLGRFAIQNLSLYLVIGQVLFWGLALMAGFDVERLLLKPGAVMSGEPWRLVTFLLAPPSLDVSALAVVGTAFGWYLFYMMGSALEEYWGAFRYNAFIGLGWFLTAGLAFITPDYYATNLFLAGSVFLAFAYLNPDFVLMIFFVIPLKIKWIAMFQWILYGVGISLGSWSTRLGILAATGNFLIFFAGDIRDRIRMSRRRMDHQAAVFAASAPEAEPRHRCRICGKTDRSHPQLDFRYCSKCAGNQCYCPDHIFNHEHVLSEDEAKPKA